MDEILNFVLQDSDNDIELGDEDWDDSALKSDWEYDTEDEENLEVNGTNHLHPVDLHFDPFDPGDDVNNPPGNDPVNSTNLDEQQTEEALEDDNHFLATPNVSLIETNDNTENYTYSESEESVVVASVASNDNVALSGTSTIHDNSDSNKSSSSSNSSPEDDNKLTDFIRNRGRGPAGHGGRGGLRHSGRNVCNRPIPPTASEIEPSSSEDDRPLARIARYDLRSQLPDDNQKPNQLGQDLPVCGARGVGRRGRGLHRGRGNCCQHRGRVLPQENHDNEQPEDDRNIADVGAVRGRRNVRRHQGRAGAGRPRGGRGVRRQQAGRGVRRQRGGRGAQANPLVDQDQNQQDQPVNQNQPPPELTWEKIENNAEQALEDFPFNEIEGLRVRVPSSPTRMDFANLYLTEKIYELMVSETNRFAEQYLQQEDVNPNNSYLRHWYPVDLSEMKQFVGLLLIMGIVHKPNIEMYWSTDSYYATPIFSQVMKRDRFRLILKFLHFNDNATLDINNVDRLHKVRPLIEMLREQFHRVYTPGKELSVDESLVLFKGRLKFKQFIRTKRARFGIKLYELCTSTGITLDFLVYSGKGMFDDDDPYSDFPSSERVPSVLMENYLGKGHVLYTDNYYTSPLLAMHFLANQTHLCGTIKNNRKNYSKDIVRENLEKGDAAFYKCNESKMVAIKYRAIKDKANKKPKVVYLLSTTHQPQMIQIAAYNPTGEPVHKPQAITSYNSHMGGVDMVDQQLHGIQTIRKTYKWYRKLAIRLLTQAFLNAHKVYKFHTGSNESFLEFLHEIISGYCSQAQPIVLNRIPVDHHKRLTERHFPVQKKPTEGTKDKHPTKECRVCRARKIRTPSGGIIKTTYLCPDCPGEPGLHPEECFKAFHTKLDYST